MYRYTPARVSLPITTFQQNRSRSRMKQSMDPLEAAFEESPPDSPIKTEPEPVNPNSNSLISLPSHIHHEQQHVHVENSISNNTKNNNSNKDDEEDEEEDEDNMDVELAKFRAVGDPHKMAKMHSILSPFTDEQMSRYESFRRAVFQKAKMTRVLANIIGTQTVSQPITIVVSGIAKMFVGEVVETARTIMKERRESGPIRPTHLREAYRRLKLEGKAFKKTVPRLFR